MNREVERAVAAVSARIGFRVDAPMRHRLEGHLTRAAAEAGCGVTGLVDALMADDLRWRELIDAVTVRETSFFRDPGQLDAFATTVLPALADPVRIWCAGCSTGQEAYSLAMLLEETGRPGGRVLATDVSPTALARTAGGRYEDRELRGLSPERVERHLRREAGTWVVQEPVRSRVEVLAHNLVADTPPMAKGQVHVVFCRNVLIYFRPEVIRDVLDRWYPWLPPGGYLFLGFSESLWQVTDAFSLERLGGSFAYRRPLTAAEPGRGAERPARPELPTPRPAMPQPAPRREPVRRPVRAEPRDAGPARGAGEPDREAGELLADGELAMAAEDPAGAAVLFRKAAYLQPDNPIPHLQLGLALEIVGDHPAARRAFQAARSALARAEPAADVQGYRPDTLHLLLDEKLKGAAR